MRTKRTTKGPGSPQPRALQFPSLSKPLGASAPLPPGKGVARTVIRGQGERSRWHASRRPVPRAACLAAPSGRSAPVARTESRPAPRRPRRVALARAALACVLALAALATPAFAQTKVPSNWSLKPTGLTTGDEFRLLFLSSTKHNGSASAIATYNTFIQGRAAAGHTNIQPTAQASGWSAAPPPSTPPPIPAPPARVSPSTGSTAPRSPTPTRISTMGPGTMRPTRRTSPAPTASIAPCQPTTPSPAAGTTAPRRPTAATRARSAPAGATSATPGPTPPGPATAPSAAVRTRHHPPPAPCTGSRRSSR